MTGIVLEEIALVARGDRLRLSLCTTPLEPGNDPVAAAHRRSGALLVHSTSWRYLDNAVVLTFARVLPDVAWSDDAGWMEVTVAELEALPVACHAVRHLHFLHRTDQGVAEVEGAADFWEFAREVVTHHYPAVAGLLD